MNIGFVNFTPIVYGVDTPYKQPLGGSESAMCYLSEHLAIRGHKVILFGRIPNSFTAREVRHEPDRSLITDNWLNLDYMVIQNTPFFGMQIKPHLGKKTKLIFWSQHNPDQPPIQLLHSPQFVSLYDALVFVSEWQMAKFIDTFGLNPQKCKVLHNAISPAFENLFKGKDILKYKPKFPLLAYTTIPQRGLDVLLDIFPEIKNAFPEVRLRVFSSMQVYQQEEDETSLKLYNRCKKMKGVKYLGSVSQTKLAHELSGVSILSYPNIVAETSCIGVMEALAAGCFVVTSDLGAIPQTSAGFAKLVAIGADREKYCRDYTLEITKVLKSYYGKNREKLNHHLKKEVDFANKSYTWKSRAREWEKFLKTV